MAACIGVAFLAFFVFLIPEIIGVISPAAEDTFSEWVFDLPIGWILVISVLFAVAGLALIWAAGHFIEGWRRRRGIERRNK